MTAAPGHVPSTNLTYYCLTLVATCTALARGCVLCQCEWYASPLA